jgi:branched-chain amino acid transport system substrate-binding protein
MSAMAILTAVRTAAADDTIKIGVLLIDTGPLAGLKDAQTKAVNLAVEQINASGGAAGRKLEPIFVSYSGTPDAAVDAASRAVQKDGALFLTGMTTSSVSPALVARLASLNALFFDDYSQSDAMTGKACNPNYVRVTKSDSMTMKSLDKFLSEKDVKSWDIITVDYASGRDIADKFQKLVKSHGGTIGKVLVTPGGTADFGAKIAQLASAPAEGLYVSVWGSDGINFAKQQAQFGLFDKYKLVLGSNFIIPQVLPSMGQSAAGVYDTLSFVAGQPGPGAKAFVDAYRSKYNGENPAYTAADQYVAIQLMAAAVAKAKSVDIKEVRSVLPGLDASTILGPVQIRAADHQLARPIALVQAAQSNDAAAAYRIDRLYSGSDVLPPIDAACKMTPAN